MGWGEQGDLCRGPCQATRSAPRSAVMRSTRDSWRRVVQNMRWQHARDHADRLPDSPDVDGSISKACSRWRCASCGSVLTHGGCVACTVWQARP